MSTLNRTLTNSKKMISIVKSLNFYSFNHKFKLNKIFKIMNTLQTDFLIIRKSTKNLFKINMIKKKNYISTFDRILTKAETKRHWKKKLKKLNWSNKKKICWNQKIRRRRQTIKCKCDARSQTNCTNWKNSFKKNENYQTNWNDWLKTET